jgi:hypothetical protein
MTTLALTLLLAAATAAPHSSPQVRATFVPATAPKAPAHTEYLVEVNKKGQVVKIVSGKFSKDYYFNEHTFGNVNQMWIRHPDMTAEVGLYRVTFDFDPKRPKELPRRVELVKPGGDWGDKEGLANVIVKDANAQTAAWEKYLQEQNKNLPSYEQIVGSPTPSPTHTLHP